MKIDIDSRMGTIKPFFLPANYMAEQIDHENSGDARKIIDGARGFCGAIDKFDASSEQPRTELVRLTAEESEIPFSQMRVGTMDEPNIYEIFTIVDGREIRLDVPVGDKDVPGLQRMWNENYRVFISSFQNGKRSAEKLREPERSKIALYITTELRRALVKVLETNGHKWAPVITG